MSEPRSLLPSPVMREHFSNVADAAIGQAGQAAPSLCVAIAAPFAGIMIDRRAETPLAVTLMYGLAGSSGLQLSGYRWTILLGLSVAGIMTTATTLIADYYTGSVRARFLGLQSASMALVDFSSRFGGFLADMNWRMHF